MFFFKVSISKMLINVKYICGFNSREVYDIV